MIAQLLGFIHQQRGIGLHPFTIATAQQTAHRLARGFAKQIPQRDVDAADCVRDGTATAQPEHVLVQFLAHAFRFESVLATIQRLKHRQRCAHQRIIGEHAAQAHRPLIGVHRNECVNAVVGPELIAPAAFRGGAAQTCAADFSDLHVGVLWRWKRIAEGLNVTPASSGKMGRGQRVCPR